MMTILPYPPAYGLTLGDYLAVLGLWWIAEENMPGTRLAWTTEGPAIEGIEDDLREVIRRAVPPPIWSPWNADSGHQGHSDAHPLARIAAHEGRRLDRLRPVIDLAASILAARGAVSKPDLIRELRSRAPDDYLPWLDFAAASDRHGEPIRHCLAGAGGNFGRYDIGRDYLAAVMLLDDALDAQMDIFLRGAARSWGPRVPGRLWWNGTDVTPLQMKLANVGLLAQAVPFRTRLGAAVSEPERQFRYGPSTGADWADDPNMPYTRDWIAPLWGAPMTLRDYQAMSEADMDGHIRYSIGEVARLPMHRAAKVIGGPR